MAGEKKRTSWQNSVYSDMHDILWNISPRTSTGWKICVAGKFSAFMDSSGFPAANGVAALPVSAWVGWSNGGLSLYG